MNSGTVTAGTLNLAGGMVTGIGSLIANVNNSSGLVSPGASPGTLTITGNYTQGPSGVLSVDIAGIVPGTQYDQLIVTGNASLGGTLNANCLGGFVAAPGDSFNVLQAGGAVSGTFAATTGSAASSLIGSYQPGSFDLIAPMPSATSSIPAALTSLSTEVIVTEQRTLDAAANDLGPGAPGEDAPVKPGLICR